jgi:hypothetical protein
MSQPRDGRQDDLFRRTLEEIINLRHSPVWLPDSAVLERDEIRLGHIRHW